MQVVNKLFAAEKYFTGDDRITAADVDRVVLVADRPGRVQNIGIECFDKILVSRLDN